MDFKDKKCDTCFYAIDRRCRRFPPKDEYYPTVIWWTKLDNNLPMPACAEYKEK